MNLILKSATPYILSRAGGCAACAWSQDEVGAREVVVARHPDRELVPAVAVGTARDVGVAVDQRRKSVFAKVWLPITLMAKSATPSPFVSPDR